jgi:hypothetical protein
MLSMSHDINELIALLGFCDSVSPEHVVFSLPWAIFDSLLLARGRTRTLPVAG